MSERLQHVEDYGEFDAICSALADFDNSEATEILQSVVAFPPEKSEILSWVSAAEKLLRCCDLTTIRLLIHQYLSLPALKENEINYGLSCFQVATGTSHWTKKLQTAVNVQFFKEYKEHIEEILDYAGLDDSIPLADRGFLSTIVKHLKAPNLSAAAEAIYSQAIETLHQKGIALETWEKMAEGLADAQSDLRTYLLRWAVIQGFAEQDHLEREGVMEDQLREEICFLLSCLLGLQFYHNDDFNPHFRDKKEFNSYLLQRVTSPMEEVPPSLEEKVAAMGQKVVPTLGRIVATQEDSWAAVRAASILSRIAQHCPESTVTVIPSLLRVLKSDNSDILIEEASNALVAMGPLVVSYLEELFSNEEADIISILYMLKNLPYPQVVDLLWKYRETLLVSYEDVFLNTVFMLGSERFIEFLEQEWRPGEEILTETLLLLCKLHDRRPKLYPELKREYEKFAEVRKRRLEVKKDNIWEPDEELKLKLSCQDCGRTYLYDIQELHVDVGTAEDDVIAEAGHHGIIIPQDIVYKKCGSVNNYRLTPEAYIYIMSQTLLFASAPDKEEFLQKSRIKFGISVLADGTRATPEKAVKHYEEVIKTEPARADLRIRYGNVLRRIGRIEEALQQYQEACKFDRSSIEGHYCLLSLYDSMGRKQEAVAAGKRLLEITAKAVNLDERDVEFAENGLDIMMRLAPALVESTDFAEDNAWSDEIPGIVRCMGPKIGRNDPYPCGSGKKYKKCCGR